MHPLLWSPGFILAALLRLVSRSDEGKSGPLGHKPNIYPTKSSNPHKYHGFTVS